MLKFFRRIRRKLIGEGKVKRYLVYAFGEILLVVVGILIALQVNIWNEGRKEKIQEEILANNFYQELLDYQKYCERFLSVSSSEEIKIDEFYLKNWRSLDLDQVKKFRSAELSPFLKSLPIKNVFSGFQYYFEPKYPYYHTASNDGTISILKDKEFINQLNFIYGTGSERMDLFYKGATEVGGAMNIHIIDNYNDLFIESNPAILADWDEATYNLFFNKIRNDGKLKSLLENRYSQLKLKRFTVERQILPNIKKTLQHFEESPYFKVD